MKDGHRRYFCNSLLSITSYLFIFPLCIRHHEQVHLSEIVMRRKKQNRGVGSNGGHAIEMALQSLKSKGYVKPCGQHCCRQCNPKGFHLLPGSPNILQTQRNKKKKQQKPSQFTRIQPYPSQCVAERVAVLAHSKVRLVNKHVLSQRLKKKPGAYIYFVVYKPPGVTSMRKAGGGGFGGRVCLDYQQNGSCSFGSKCRFKHPGVFQKRTVYDVLPLNWPPVPHVGRLDVATEGLLLFTDDGRLQSTLLEKGNNLLQGNRRSNDGNDTCDSYRKRKTEDINVALSHNTQKNARKIYLVQVSAEKATSSSSTSIEHKNNANSQTISADKHLHTVCCSVVDNHDSQKSKLKRIQDAILTTAVMDSLRQPFHYPDGKITSPATIENIQPQQLRNYLKKFPRQAHKNESNKLRLPTAWVKITLIEGRNRQVRRLCERASLHVHRLVRWSFGPISMDVLQGASVCALSKAQVCMHMIQIICVASYTMPCDM